MDLIYMFENLMEAFSLYNVLVALIGVTLGIYFGAVPGINASVTLAVMLPFSLFMPPGAALTLLGAGFMGVTYGGSITATVINVPGAPTSMVTGLEGYPLTKQGKAKMALGVTATASFFGGLIGVAILIVASRPIIQLVLNFGPAEIFFIVFFAVLVVINAVMRMTLPIYAILCGSLGILLGQVGFHTITGAERYTLGSSYFYDGFPLLPTIVGVFAVSEAFNLIGSSQRIVEMGKLTGNALEGFMETIKRPVTVIRSALIGSFIGATPGTGGVVSNLISYTTAKQLSKNPDEFGKGSIDGLIAAEASNNAVVGTAMIPTLTMGIPGCLSSALVLAALQAHGLTVGPRLFVQNTGEVYTFYWGLLIATFAMLVIGLSLAGFFARIAQIPPEILAPMILVLAFVGAYAHRYEFKDIFLAIGVGLFVFLFRRHNFSPLAFIMGFILGPMADKEFLRALMLHKNFWGMVTASPISMVLSGLCLLFIVMLIRGSLKRFKQERAVAKS